MTRAVDRYINFHNSIDRYIIVVPFEGRRVRCGTFQNLDVARVKRNQVLEQIEKGTFKPVMPPRKPKPEELKSTKILAELERGLAISDIAYKLSTSNDYVMQVAKENNVQHTSILMKGMLSQKWDKEFNRDFLTS